MRGLMVRSLSGRYILAIAISVYRLVSTHPKDDSVTEPANTTVQLDGMIVNITLKILRVSS